VHAALRIDLGAALEVQVVGHMADHRWTTCPADDQKACQARFVVDRLLPADATLDDFLPEPWAIPPYRSVDGASEAVEILSGVVGGVSVVSIGNADANGVRSIEPLVEEINNEEGAWVIRALVAGDSVPVARTFLVGHIGHWTVFEVTESRVVDRISQPVSSWPPNGVRVVPMPALDSGVAPRAGVVDRTGLLVEARAADETDPGRGSADLQPGEMAIVQAATDTIIAWWGGSLCDDRFVLTAYGERIGLPPDRLELRGESAGGCQLALVYRGIVLRFSGLVDAASIDGWDRVGTPFETFPPVDSTVVALPKPGGFDLPRVRAALVDLSGRITSARLPRADEPRPATTWDGQGALVPDPSVAGRYQLIWNGGVCTPDIVVTIDAALSNVVVSNPVPGNCDTVGNEYRLVLDIDGPLDPPAVEVRHTLTSAGAS
jgi:hypothetical protein